MMNQYDKIREANDALYNKALEIIKLYETALIELKASREENERLKLRVAELEQRLNYW
jgi:cell shape-determining protein MreC